MGSYAPIYHILHEQTVTMVPGKVQVPQGEQKKRLPPPPLHGDVCVCVCVWRADVMGWVFA